jgi:hypothetical protein
MYIYIDTVTAHWVPLTAPRGAVPTTLRTTALQHLHGVTCVWLLDYKIALTEYKALYNWKFL